MQPNNPQRPNPANQRPQFFDVVRPGRTPASPNSRPVLPNSQPAVVDNSMKAGAPAVPPGLLRPPVTPVAQPVPTPVQSAAAPRPNPVVTVPTQPINRPVAPVMPQRQVTQPTSVEPTRTSVGMQPETPEQPKPTHQKRSFWSEFLAVLAIVLLVGVIINILLDAEIINLPLPHTNFFDY